MDLELLGTMIREGYVMVNWHPNGQLKILNYTIKTQFDKVWNSVTLQTRGLILDANNKIVARPFPKFFNYEEVREQIPRLPYRIFDKLDGSLGILYWGDRPAIASRGSFTSEQAAIATRILRSKYSSVPLDKNITYLFEIIYPQNRIVVDYQELEDIILIGMINTATGEEYDIKNQSYFLTPNEIFCNTENLYQELKHQDLSNKEGFVLQFSNGFRCKIKFDNYLYLHKICTQISVWDIWKSLAMGIDITEFIYQKDIPDELFSWVKDTRVKLQEQYNEILMACINAFKVLEDRKSTARYFLSQPFPHILFLMLDNKEWRSKIWGIIEPKNTKESLNSANLNSYRYFSRNCK